ncbi:MAG: glycosyltransferase family 2 protein [Candidatus Nanohaloarchaea archaeon]
MFFLLAWLLIGGATFLALFYLNIFMNRQQGSLPELDSYPSVSILIPAYNEEKTIEDALESALEIDYSPLKVLMIDDGSTDSTLEKARSFEESERLEIIEKEKNEGKAQALNRGLEEIDSEYAVVQDADTVIHSNLLRKGLRKFQHDPELGAVIGAIQNFESDTFVRKLQRVQYQMTNFYRNLMSSIETLDVTPGAFSLYRTSDLEKVGGFDEGNPTEDLEMAWRLRKLGRNLEMVYSAESRTEFPESFRDLYRQRVRWKRGSIVNSIKHREMFLDSDYGWFGRWQLPVHVISPLLASASLVLVIFGFGESIFNMAVSYSAVGFQLPSLEAMSLSRILLGLQFKIYVPLLIGMVISAVMIRTAYRAGGKKVRNPLAVMVYFLWFFAIQGFFTLSAIIKEMLRSKRVWN